MKLQEVIKLLNSGKVGVMPTDTIYGIVGSALNPKTVEEIYRLRKRAPEKPMIILISSLKDLEKFEINLTNTQKEFLEKIWPNPVSVVLPCNLEKFKYLHRGTNSLAFRMPKDKRFLEILRKVGPIVAPSANFEGKKFAETINEAKKYFGDSVAFYCEATRSSYKDGGDIKTMPSTLVTFDKDLIKVLRKGSFKI